MKQPGKALGSGVAGAAAVTLVHETIKKFVPQAPRLDLLGMQAVEKMLNKSGDVPVSQNKLYGQALAGDLLTNSLYYSIAGIGNRPWLVGLLAGVGAGIAAISLPKEVGLNQETTARTPATKAMTIGLYALGGLVAAGVASLLSNEKQDKSSDGLDLRFKRTWRLKD